MDLGLCLRTPLQRVFLTVLVIVTCARGVLAECLVPPPPCTALEKTAIVFVGDVTSAGPIENHSGENAPHLFFQPVRFRVIERFKGMPEGQTDVDGAVQFNAEAILFASVLRYVVYASLASDGTWRTACSRTCTVKVCPDEIRQLRLCKRP
jgi:hypothetical protein